MGAVHVGGASNGGPIGGDGILACVMLILGIPAMYAGGSIGDYLFGLTGAIIGTFVGIIILCAIYVSLHYLLFRKKSDS